MYTKINIEIRPHTKKPINKGSVVSNTKRPIYVLIGTAIRVAINPVIAAPIPAICPIGSMASALKFPNKKPMAKNCAAKNNNNHTMSGLEVS